ncbi:MAG: hypothetical protein AB8B67_01090 [Rickettsiaceae bacterium]
MKQNIVLLFCVSMILASCTRTTTVRRTSDYTNALAKSNGMIALSPMVEVSTVDIAGKATRNYNYENQVEDTIIDVLLPKLKNKGYNVRFFSKKEVHNHAISRDILSFKEQYQEQINPLYVPILWEEKKAFNINSLVTKGINVIHDTTRADIAVLVEYNGRINTSGACMKNFAISFFIGVKDDDYAAESTSIRLTIVDIINGKILWSNITQAYYSMFSFDSISSIDKVDRKRLDTLFNTLLTPLLSRS